MAEDMNPLPCSASTHFAGTKVFLTIYILYVDVHLAIQDTESTYGNPALSG